MKKDDVIALVVGHTLNDLRMVCMTELMSDGKWRCGLMVITSIDDVLDRAEKEHLPIIMEATMRSKEGCKRLAKIFHHK